MMEDEVNASGLTGQECGARRQRRQGFPVDSTTKIGRFVDNLASMLLILVYIASCGAVFGDDVVKSAHGTAEMMRRFLPVDKPDFSMLDHDDVRSMGTSYTATGYISATSFTDAACTTPSLTVGYAANTCIIDDGFAYMARLVQDSCTGGVIEYYYDTKCTKYAGSSPLTRTVITGCHQTPFAAYTAAACTSTDSPLVFTTSVVNKVYGDSSCGAISQYVAEPSDVCHGAQVTGEVDVMLQCSNSGTLTEVRYEAFSNCAANRTLQTETIPPTCTQRTFAHTIDASIVEKRLEARQMLEQEEDTDADATYYSTGELYPPPSVSTTAFPTSPSQLDPVLGVIMYCQAPPTPQTVVLDVSQTIDGISLSTYNSDVSAYSLTLKQTIASCFTGATTNSVTNLVVTEGPSSSAAALLNHYLSVRVAHRALAGSSILTTYTMTLANSLLSADSVAGELQNAVANGKFDNNLHTYAQANGATGFETATSSSVDVSVEGDDDGGGSDDKLSTGAIVGIAIGAFAALVLVLGAVWYFCRSGKKGDEAAGARTNGVAQVSPMAPAV